MWMGGVPPLGYCPDGRSLAIIEEQAQLVRQLYERYLILGSVRALDEDLTARAIHAPRRVTGTGKAYGGRPFARGNLYRILKNPIYAGDIVHSRKISQPGGGTRTQTQIYPGNHPAIIPREQWDQVQRQLADHVQGPRRGRAPTRSLLAGRLFDEAGRSLIASHASKPGARGSAARRYHYYLSRADDMLQGGEEPWRIAAGEIEPLVLGAITRLLADPLSLAAQARLDIAPHSLPRIDARCTVMRERLGDEPHAALAVLDPQVTLNPNSITIALPLPALAAWLGLEPASQTPSPLKLSLPVTLKRTGHVMRFIRTDGTAANPKAPDPALINLLLRGRAWWRVLKAGELTPTQLAAREGFTVSYLLRAVRLAFLSPAIVEALLEGTLRADTNAATLLNAESYPIRWKDQEQMFLPG